MNYLTESRKSLLLMIALIAVAFTCATAAAYVTAVVAALGAYGWLTAAVHERDHEHRFDNLEDKD